MLLVSIIIVIIIIIVIVIIVIVIIIIIIIIIVIIIIDITISISIIIIIITIYINVRVPLSSQQPTYSAYYQGGQPVERKRRGKVGFNLHVCFQFAHLWGGFRHQFWNH